MLCYIGSQVRVQREQMQVVVQVLRPSFMLGQLALVILAVRRIS